MRRRVGWFLLGCALAVMALALPVWALAAGDLDAVAVWANILALPVSVAGLMLVLADRNQARAGGGSGTGRRRRPWMAPPLDRMVERPELGGWLLAALTGSGPALVGLTTGLHGAGGFGKTRLATWVCHRPEISRRYPGGLLWVTVGQEVRGADLAVRINDLAFALCGRRPAISDPDAAGAELGRLLDDREPVLLVVDDVWEESQLRPFRFGGRRCTRLVTTRIPGLLSGTGSSVAVDAMSADQARALVADRVAGLPADLVERLAHLAGRWPVLLNLVNGTLRSRVARGQPPLDAAREIVGKLLADGPAVFDPAHAGDRNRAVAATVEASLALLDPVDQQCYFDLAIFPEDVDIPLYVLRLLWPDRPMEAFLEELVELGLAADYRLDPPGPRLVLHDVMRAFLQTRRTAMEQFGVHRRLSEAAAGLLPAGNRRVPEPWWLLPADVRYLWRYLPHHLRQAGRTTELAALVCDLRWVEAKTARFGSVVPVEADLELARTSTAGALRRALRQAAHLLSPIDPPTALGATLASRLYGAPELRAVLDRYRATLPRPRLEPAWPLPDQADPARSTGVDGHTGGVTDCAFSPDGTVVATASDDGTVRLWNVADHTVGAVLSGHTAGVWGCAFSPDGTVLATTGDDRTARVWQVATGRELAVLRGHSDWATGCAFSPDGLLLATASSDGTVRLWNVADHTVRAVFAGHTGGVWGCAFSPDGVLLVTASGDGTARLWTVADHTTQRVLTGHTREVRGCAFSPDGRLVATASSDMTVRLWKVADGTMTAVLTGHTERVWSCAFSPDGGLLATAAHDGTVRLCRVGDHTTQRVFAGHAGWVRGCAFSPDGALIATGGSDQTVRLWNIGDGTTRVVLAGRTGNVRGCAFSPDGGLLATTTDHGAVHLIRLPGSTARTTFHGHSGRVNRCAFSPDSTLLATTSDDGTARLWHVPGGVPGAVLAGHTGRLGACGFSPDGVLLATTSADRTARLWHMPAGEPGTVLAGHTGPLSWGCAFSPDGALLATCGNDQTARLWKVADATAVTTLTGHTDIVTSCAFSPDGALLATTSDDRTARIWRIDDRATHVVLSGHSSWVEDCAFSPDGTLLATVSRDSTVRLWRVADGSCECALRVGGPLLGTAWHPDATMICAVGGAGTYLLAYLP